LQKFFPPEIEFPWGAYVNLRRIYRLLKQHVLHADRSSWHTVGQSIELVIYTYNLIRQTLLQLTRHQHYIGVGLHSTKSCTFQALVSLTQKQTGKETVSLQDY